MRAVLVSEHGGHETLQVVDRPVPDPGSGEMRIAVEAAGLNAADAAKRRGEYPGGPTPPYVPGIEVAGTVDTTGEDVSVPRGTPVVAVPSSGGCAEYVIASRDRVFPAPTELAAVERAAVPVHYLTAHNCCFEWNTLRPNDRLLVTGAAGGVGAATVECAVNRGARVFGVASSEVKRSVVGALGCEGVLSYGEIPDRVDHLTDGVGVDVVIEGVGGGTFDAALAALAPGGTLVSYGMAGGGVPTVAVPRLFYRNQRLVGYHLEEALEREPARVRRAWPDIRAGFDRRDLTVRIAETYPLSDAVGGYTRQEDRDRIGKVVLTVS